MKTKVLKINESNFSDKKIRLAAGVIKKGGLVAFPTETVYGIGANALEPKAVKKIFKAKGRPQDNPLIVHISSRKEVRMLAEEIPKNAEKLMKEFWPGPLAIILKKSKIVPSIVTGGLGTVAIRMPAHKTALALIKEAGVPIAAPSANISGKPSPTKAEHVILDLKGKVDLIIDGGDTKIGVESTVIDLTSNPPVLLRPGKITPEKMKKILGKIKLHSAVKTKNKTENKTVKSPGMKYRHYSPDAEVIVVEGKPGRVKAKITELAEKYSGKGKKVGIITNSKKHNYSADTVKFAGNNFNEIARNLFKHFREFDEEKTDLILAEGVKEKELGLAIMNRLKKAAYKTIKA